MLWNKWIVPPPPHKFASLPVRLPLGTLGRPSLRLVVRLHCLGPKRIWSGESSKKWAPPFPTSTGDRLRKAVVEHPLHAWPLQAPRALGRNAALAPAATKNRVVPYSAPANPHRKKQRRRFRGGRREEPGYPHARPGRYMGRNQGDAGLTPWPETRSNSQFEPTRRGRGGASGLDGTDQTLCRPAGSGPGSGLVAGFDRRTAGEG